MITKDRLTERDCSLQDSSKTKNILFRFVEHVHREKKCIIYNRKVLDDKTVALCSTTVDNAGAEIDDKLICYNHPPDKAQTKPKAKGAIASIQAGRQCQSIS